MDIPICVYNIPGRTGKNIEPDTIVRMAELPNITMVKEATGSMDQASQILANTDLTLLSGDDSLTLPLLSLGGRGVVSVVGNIVPADVIAMILRLRRRRPRRSPSPALSTLPAVPRHAGLGEQSDPDQGRDADARPRHGRLADALDAADGRRGSKASPDAHRLWVVVRLWSPLPSGEDCGKYWLSGKERSGKARGKGAEVPRNPSYRKMVLTRMALELS